MGRSLADNKWFLIMTEEATKGRTGELDIGSGSWTLAVACTGEEYQLGVNGFGIASESLRSRFGVGLGSLQNALIFCDSFFTFFIFNDHNANSPSAHQPDHSTEPWNQLLLHHSVRNFEFSKESLMRRCSSLLDWKVLVWPFGSSVLSSSRFLLPLLWLHL